MMPYRILFLVEFGNAHYLCVARNREDAKRQAHSWMGGGDSDNYTVTPLTQDGDRIHVAITVQV